MLFLVYGNIIMKLGPKISVILPFYNAESTLYRALNSIKQQSFTDFECIMVDNNSTDNSAIIASKFAITDKRFLLTSESAQGVAYASNKGSNIARGDYIARMDADDESLPNRLKLQYDFLRQNKDYGAVGGLVEYVAHIEGNTGFADFVTWNNSLISYRQIYINRFMEMPIINPSAMWRKSISISLGTYHNGDFPEDYQMWLRWLAEGIKIAKVPYKVLRWYDSKTRLTRSDKRYSIEAFYKVKTPYLSKFMKQINVHYPRVGIWGASKIARKRANLLLEYGVEICCFIDITKKRQLAENTMFYKDIPPKGELFILVYVKQKLMRDRVEDFLLRKEYILGKDFLFVS
jgi:glycosyltransferase involved in cell wall biosynthesis